MSTRVPNCNQFVSLGFPCTSVVCPACLRKLLGSVEQNEPTWTIHSHDNQKTVWSINGKPLVKIIIRPQLVQCIKFFPVPENNGAVYSETRKPKRRGSHNENWPTPGLIPLFLHATCWNLTFVWDWIGESSFFTWPLVKPLGYVLVLHQLWLSTEHYDQVSWTVCFVSWVWCEQLSWEPSRLPLSCSAMFGSLRTMNWFWPISTG